MLKISRSYSKWANMFSSRPKSRCFDILSEVILSVKHILVERKISLDKMSGFDHICEIQNRSKFHFYGLSVLKKSVLVFFLITSVHLLNPFFLLELY